MSNSPINVYETEFPVVVRILDDPRGTLLVPTPDQQRLKWNELREATIRRYVGAEEDKLAAIAQIDYAQEREAELYQQIEEQRGSEIKEFSFSFRRATVGEQREAESKANAGAKYEPLVHGSFLAQKTLKETDFPGFKTIDALRSDIGLHVCREVVSHVTFSEDPSEYLKPLAAK